MDFEPPPIPRRQRPQRPSYAPVTARELLLDGSFKDRPGLPISEADPGAIVRSPSGAIAPQSPGAIVHQPRGLAVHQRYPVYSTPGFISSEPGTQTQPASKAQFKLQLKKFPRLKLPNLPKLRLPHWKRPAPSRTTTTSPSQPKSQPKSQPDKPSEKLAGFKLPKPALSGAGFGSIGLGRSGKLSGKGSSDNFGDDPIAQLLVKVFLVLLILIPLIL